MCVCVCRLKDIFERRSANNWIFLCLCSSHCACVSLLVYFFFTQINILELNFSDLKAKRMKWEHIQHSAPLINSNALAGRNIYRCVHRTSENLLPIDPNLPFCFCLFQEEKRNRNKSNSLNSVRKIIRKFHMMKCPLAYTHTHHFPSASTKWMFISSGFAFRTVLNAECSTNRAEHIFQVHREYN